MRAPLILLVVLALVTACTNIDTAVMDSGSQLAIRQMQTREFRDIEKGPALRAVISTLQDLGFVIDKADAVLGSVTGTKLQNYSIVMTVTVRPRDSGVLVRANANYNKKAIEDPEPYQDFFVSLDKAIFLLKNKVD